MLSLAKVISGGQTGIDQLALRVAREVGLTTGGSVPHGWWTLDGPAPWLGEVYGCEQSSNRSYRERTWQNVDEADGTLRLALDFSSPGERCTINAIRHYRRPVYDVDLALLTPAGLAGWAKTVQAWLRCHKVNTLNVAGNSYQTMVQESGPAGALAVQQLARKLLVWAFRE